MEQVGFGGRILMLGCGGVARCTLPLLLRHLKMRKDRITVLDMSDDCRESIAACLEQGVQFVRMQITPENYAAELARYVGSGDLIIDLAWNIATIDLLEWCRGHGVRYVNTSVELWDPYTGAESLLPTERTLYVRHMAIRQRVASWGSGKGPTAILEHGANPGLVSHFAKTALLDIAEQVLERGLPSARHAGFIEAFEQRAFNRLAQLLGVRVIHISERDTQTTRLPREPDSFVNTWSPEGFREESIAPAELGWGTHERALPPGGHPHREGPCNQICLEQFGMNTLVKSRVPSAEIVGMVIRHGESFSISEALTVHDAQGQAVYRPTVHYAYLPAPIAIQSLEEMRAADYRMQDRWHVLSNEIINGADELGCLLMGHDFKSWWTGTILDIHEARRLVPGQNATTLQVAASVLAAVAWMIHHPERGVLLPDQLPHDDILTMAAPYLGRMVSEPIDWQPVGDDSPLAINWQSDAAWQFDAFRAPRNARPCVRRTRRRAAVSTSAAASLVPAESSPALLPRRPKTRETETLVDSRH